MSTFKVGFEAAWRELTALSEIATSVQARERLTAARQCLDDAGCIELGHEEAPHGHPGEHCKRCRRRNVIRFSVPDAVWHAVTRGRWNILCGTCFDEEAHLLGVSYTFGAVHPVSWSDGATRAESPRARRQ